MIFDCRLSNTTPYNVRINGPKQFVLHGGHGEGGSICSSDRSVYESSKIAVFFGVR